MKPSFIYLIRHGESEGNVDNSIYSHTPDWKINLTKKGEEQATEAGVKLAKDFVEEWINVPERKRLIIYTSPWYRTRQTAKLINRSFNAEIREDPRIREQEWGNYAEEHSKQKIERERKEFGTFFYESYERKPRALCPWMNRVINRDSSDLQCTF
jgi:broad specificity phosphatase PhoE